MRLGLFSGGPGIGPEPEPWTTGARKPREGRCVYVKLVKSPNLICIRHTLSHVHQHQNPRPSLLPYSCLPTLVCREE